MRYVDRGSIKLENGDVVHRHMMDGDAVLFNRQPSLHRMSMMCHIVKVMKKGDTFRMNVADTKPYNADEIFSSSTSATGSVKSVLLPSE